MLTPVDCMQRIDRIVERIIAVDDRCDPVFIDKAHHVFATAAVADTDTVYVGVCTNQVINQNIHFRTGQRADDRDMSATAYGRKRLAECLDRKSVV